MLLQHHKQILIGLQLRCDVVQEPQYVPCRRCQRLNLGCRIDANFRRIGKRSKNAEMEREIVELRMQLSSQQGSPTIAMPQVKMSASATTSPTMPHMQSSMDQYIGSQEAVASLMELRTGVDSGAFLGNMNGHASKSHRLENILLAPESVHDLFQRWVLTDCLLVCM